MSLSPPVRETYEGESEAESSRNRSPRSDREADVEEEFRTDAEDPVDTVVRPLTQEELEAFNAAQERAGIVYISRIPPGMQPSKVRHLMSQHGVVGRVYLQQEGVC